MELDLEEKVEKFLCVTANAYQSFAGVGTNYGIYIICTNPAQYKVSKRFGKD